MAGKKFLAAKCFGGNIFWREKRFGRENVLAGIDLGGKKSFWRENALARKCFGGKKVFGGKMFWHVLAGIDFGGKKFWAGKCFRGFSLDPFLKVRFHINYENY